MFSIHSIRPILQMSAYIKDPVGPVKDRPANKLSHEKPILVPAGDGNDLVSAECQVPLRTGSVLTENHVHHAKELLDALVLSQVLATLH